MCRVDPDTVLLAFFTPRHLSPHLVSTPRCVLSWKQPATLIQVPTLCPDSPTEDMEVGGGGFLPLGSTPLQEQQSCGRQNRPVHHWVIGLPLSSTKRGPGRECLWQPQPEASLLS